jgi:hypothetical protein
MKRWMPAEMTLYLNSPDLSAETLQDMAEVLIGLARALLVCYALLAYVVGAGVEMWRIAARAWRAVASFRPAYALAAWELGRLRWRGIFI